MTFVAIYILALSSIIQGTVLLIHMLNHRRHR